ncbi:hypothetical protein ILUMI_11146, partial [Ignelater luminosus]
VVGIARRKNRVDDLAKAFENKPGKLYPLKADVTNEEEIIQAFNWIKNSIGPISILINNAGIVRGTTLTDGSTKLWKQVLDTNVLSLCIATREAIRSMRDNNIDGHIVHLNSVAGHMVPPLPQFNVYPASKYAVTALTETLRQELNFLGSKIKVTSVSPGAVATEIVQAAGDTLSEGLRNHIKGNPNILRSEDIADAVLYALATPPHVQVHEIIIKPVGEAF